MSKVRYLVGALAIVLFAGFCLSSEPSRQALRAVRGGQTPTVIITATTTTGCSYNRWDEWLDIPCGWNTKNVCNPPVPNPNPNLPPTCSGYCNKCPIVLVDVYDGWYETPWDAFDYPTEDDGPQWCNRIATTGCQPYESDDWQCICRRYPAPPPNPRWCWLPSLVPCPFTWFVDEP